MERRKALTTAAAATLTLLAGAGGIALNSGLVAAGGHHGVGRLSPVATIADDPATPGAAPAVRPSGRSPVTTSAASGYHDGQSGHDDDDEGQQDD